MFAQSMLSQALLSAPRPRCKGPFVGAQGGRASAVQMAFDVVDVEDTAKELIEQAHEASEQVAELRKRSTVKPEQGAEVGDGQRPDLRVVRLIDDGRQLDLGSPNGRALVARGPRQRA